MNRLLVMLLSCFLSYLLVYSDSQSALVRPAGEVAACSGKVKPALAPLSLYGLAVQVDSAHEPVDRYGRMVREIAGLGASAVLFSVNGYQANAGSTSITIDPLRTPTDDQWRELFGIARRQGLRSVFMPKILLSQPRGNEWRGVIEPAGNWDSWFESYRRFILHYARLAEECGVEVFIVGSELVSTEKHTVQWKGLIGEIRAACPSATLTYSANWDHYESIGFWDDLDVVALTSYYQTAKAPGPEISTLMSSWAWHRDAILRWQSTVGKPILFTEVGWCSQEGCSVEPWNYYRRPESSPAALEEQRLNYEAFVQVWGDCPSLAGVIWWEWTPGEGGHHDHGYTPKNKPAEAVLSRWFDNLRTFQKNAGHVAAE